MSVFATAAPPDKETPNMAIRIRMSAACVALALMTHGAAASPPRLADFGFDMDNTSPAPTTPVERARLAALDAQLAGALQSSGLYQVLDLGKQAAALRSTTLNIRNCNGCELAVAVQQNARLAAYGWVQKVSDLILNINLVIEDVKTGKQVSGGSVDIRGNTDESWSRGLRFLLEEHVLKR